MSRRRDCWDNAPQDPCTTIAEVSELTSNFFVETKTNKKNHYQLA